MNRAWCFVALFALAFAAPAFGQAEDFPFDQELFLDAEPMPGSKRIPNIEIDARGAMAFEMWCNRVEGQMTVAADTITITAGPPTERSCTPEQTQRDAQLLAAVTAATNWRLDGDDLVLVGPALIRFKPSTH